jgi:hypothetical protein
MIWTIVTGVTAALAGGISGWALRGYKLSLLLRGYVPHIPIFGSPKLTPSPLEKTVAWLDGLTVKSEIAFRREAVSLSAELKRLL